MTRKITRRQLRKMISEALGDQARPDFSTRVASSVGLQQYFNQKPGEKPKVGTLFPRAGERYATRNGDEFEIIYAPRNSNEDFILRWERQGDDEGPSIENYNQYEFMNDVNHSFHRL